jgi:hypothetical protein
VDDAYRRLDLIESSWAALVCCHFDGSSPAGGREKFTGQPPRFAPGNSKPKIFPAQGRSADIDETKIGDVYLGFFPIRSRSKVTNEFQIPLEETWTKPAQHGGQYAGVPIKTFPEGAFFKFSPVAMEAFAKQDLELKG